MVNVRPIRVVILAITLLLSLNLSGCSVFSTIGGWISSRYDDTIAYFNAYYNAKRLFDEAEAEVLAARTASKGKAAGASITPASSTARQKFASVIDKCSNILSFYPKSGIVDDALFLIGKSYFYQDDFLKAERKFKELLVQNPGGSLAMDGQLWLLKTLQKLNRFDEANQVGQDLATAALAAGRPKIAGEAYSLLGDVAAAQNNTDVAIERYSKSVGATNDGVMKAAAQMKIGELYFNIPDYEKAAAAFLEVDKFSPDDYSLYYSQLQASICYRDLKRFDDALRILRNLDNDYRFLDNRAQIRFELGSTLAESGKLNESVDMLQAVDTTYARTETGARAALELGKLFQHRLGEYVAARTAFSHAAAGGTAEVIKEAARKVSAFDNYFRLQHEYFTTDSLLSVISRDSILNKQEETESVQKKDSTRIVLDTSQAHGRSDSLKALQDTALSSRSLDTSASAKAKAVPIPKRAVLLDSLGSIYFQLGDLFYAELNVPDSAFYWLRQGLKSRLDSVKAPRALYDLADIAHTGGDSTYGDSNDLYRQILDKYPTSKYAEEARIALGFKPVIKKEDPAMFTFAVAESLMYAGEYSHALDSLGSIVQRYPDSPVTPKSIYTMAWIYENQLSLPDSALAKYRTLASKFVATKYGIAASRRIPPDAPPPAVKADSARTTLRGVGTAVPDSTKKMVPDSTLKTQAPGVLPGPTDTLRVKPKLQPVKSDSTKKNLDVDEIERKAAAQDTLKSRRAKAVVKE